MKNNPRIIRNGFDKKKCFVHARCCFAPDIAVATAQYLDISGSDLFSGLCSSISTDGGVSWSEFSPEEGLAPIKQGDLTVVGCDATPIYHEKTGKILLIGQTASYTEGAKHPDGKFRKTFYSVFDQDTKSFGQMRFIDVGIANCGNGSGQSVELENGDFLIPIYMLRENRKFGSAVMKCSFDGESLTFLEIGNVLTCDVGRGLCEPSLVYHEGVYYMTLRNDECAMVSSSKDGLRYDDLHLWQWADGSLLDSYNTQQHWMKSDGKLYLVYTRRAENNSHVFRHRAPLFAARVEKMKLVRESEYIVIPEKGARLGNFGVTEKDGKGVVMAAEWMQPVGCEKYGSDNNIFLYIEGEDI